jgi:hypothetical protein
MTTRQPPIDPATFDIDGGVRELPPKQINARQNGIGYIWNGQTCELIPILPEGHPQYRQNQERLLGALRRWDARGKR